MERKGPYPSDDDLNNNDDFDNNDRPAEPSAGSGLALLSADGWRDVCPYLDFYDNAMLRFASSALNRLIHRDAFTLPLRVIAASYVIVGHVEHRNGFWARAFEADLKTPWRDLTVHASPESMLLEVYSKCKGFTVAVLELRKLLYNELLTDAMVQCLPFFSVTRLFVNGVTSGHDQVHHLLENIYGLRSVSFKNDAAQPNSASVLSVCAARKLPSVSLKFAADVTEAEILDFLFNNNSSRISRQFHIPSLRRSLSEKFFEAAVERCHRNMCKSLRFALGGLLTDPTDAKYSRYVVERDENTTMYKFDKIDHKDVPLTVVVGV
ncbi:hypothetical protein AAVH_16916 [Aphelenchoides avenae]|nr:hypothetical protein AAVH_16916 [Aphelenchus avenae]